MSFATRSIWCAKSNSDANLHKLVFKYNTKTFFYTTIDIDSIMIGGNHEIGKVFEENVIQHDSHSESLNKMKSIFAEFKESNTKMIDCLEEMYEHIITYCHKKITTNCEHEEKNKRYSDMILMRDINHPNRTNATTNSNNEIDAYNGMDMDYKFTKCEDVKDSCDKISEDSQNENLKSSSSISTSDASQSNVEYDTMNTLNSTVDCESTYDYVDQESFPVASEEGTEYTSNHNGSNVFVDYQNSDVTHFTSNNHDYNCNHSNHFTGSNVESYFYKHASHNNSNISEYQNYVSTRNNFKHFSGSNVES